MRDEAIKEVKAILGLTTEITGVVLISPSSIGIKETQKAAREIPLEGSLKNLGVFVANDLADDLETKGHRPANYSDVKDLGKNLRSRIVAALKDEEQAKVFDEAFVAQMRNRG